MERKERNPETIERRCFPMEVRAGDGKSAKLTLRGYAAVFNSETVLIPANAWYQGSPEVREVIEPGAFAKTLREGDQRAVWNHNMDYVLGRRANKTLRLWEDEHGLGNEIFPPDTGLIRDMVIAPIERGDVNQMSFAFRVIRDKVEEADGVIKITLRELDLIEVSPVAVPAYADTEISARSANRIEELRQSRQTASEGAPLTEHPPTAQTPKDGHPVATAPLDPFHLRAVLAQFAFEATQ